MPNLLKVYPKLTKNDKEMILYYIDFDKYMQPYIGGKRQDGLSDIGFLDKNMVISILQNVLNNHSGVFGGNKYAWTSLPELKLLVKKLKED